MKTLRMVADFFRETSPRHWPALTHYFLASVLFRRCGLRLFTERILHFKDFQVAVSVDGMNGLNFFHEIHFRGVYRFLDRASAAGIRQVFDVGANCGYFTLEEARQNPAWRFRCFEPHPRTFATLERNLRANGLADRARASQIAIGSEAGICEMIISPASSMAVAAVATPDTERPATIAVPQRTLDAVAAEDEVFPDLLKIDVEGYEVSVLDGAQICLQRAKHVILEFHSDALGAACRERLEAAGFQCCTRDSLLIASRAGDPRP